MRLHPASQHQSQQAMNGPVHGEDEYNQTTLDKWGYQVFRGNGTLSNGTDCYLSFGEFKPVLYENGTLSNYTSCDYPLYPIATRGAVGMTWAILMILGLIVTLFCLHKHGMQYTEEKKRFRRFGRKWPWYWLIVLEAISAAAGFFSIDLDRDYLQGSSLTAYAAIYCATLPVSLACTWELTRHWGSFEERKIYDEDPFRFRDDDTRSRVHLFMPLIFYLLGFLSFLLTVLRNWNNVRNNPSQAVDIRWKIGVIFAILAWIQIWAQIVVTRYFYKVSRIPLVIPTVLGLTAVLLVMHMTFLWNYQFSPFNVHSSIPFVACMGYLPIFLIVVIMNLSGLARENEDQVILALRNERERTNMAALMERPEKSAIASPSTSPVTTSSSSDDSKGYSETNKRQSAFFKFFGTARTKGFWLAHNLRYIPFRNKNRSRSRSQKTSTSTVVPATTTTATSAKPRPKPVDLREKWKVKSATGV